MAIVLAWERRTPGRDALAVRDLERGARIECKMLLSAREERRIRSVRKRSRERMDRQHAWTFAKVVPRLLRHVHLNPREIERRFRELVAPREVAAQRRLRRRAHEGRTLLDVWNRFAALEDDRPTVLPRHGQQKRFTAGVVVLVFVRTRAEEHGPPTSIGRLHEIRMP